MAAARCRLEPWAMAQVLSWVGPGTFMKLGPLYETVRPGANAHNAIMRHTRIIYLINIYLSSYLHSHLSHAPRKPLR